MSCRKKIQLKQKQNFVVFTRKNGLVGQDFISYIYSTQMQFFFLLLQHRFCIHNGKRKLKLATVSVNLVLCFISLRLIVSFCFVL